MKKKVVVLGAGISGLARAFALKEHFKDEIDLKILDAASRPGGWIKTIEKEGFLFEQGPRSLRTKGAGLQTLALVEKLGLEGEVIAASQQAKYRYLYTEGSLQCLPTNIFSFFGSKLMKGVLPALIKEFTKAFDPSQDMSIKEFIGKRFSDSIADRLFDPLVSGIFAGDIAALSMRSSFPMIYQMATRDGSIGKALMKQIFKKQGKEAMHSPFIQAIQKSPIFSFKRGMQTLVDGLSCHLDKELFLGCSIKSLSFNGSSIELLSECGEVFLADELHVAISAKCLSALVEGAAPLIAGELLSLKATSVVVLNMGWRELSFPYKGFGYLIPTSEKEDILGVVWDSSVFFEQNNSEKETRLTVMLGGVHRQDICKLNDEAICAIGKAALQKHLNIKTSPDVVHLVRAPSSIPQYNRGHEDTVSSIEKQIAKWSRGKIYLIGSSWRGISVNDCIAEGLVFSLTR